MKKRLFKNAVAILSLVAMLTQNAYTAYAAMEGAGTYEAEQTVEETVEEVAEETYDESAEGTEVVTFDGEVEETGEEPTSDVNYDDQVMPIDEEYAEEVVEEPTEEVAEETTEEVIEETPEEIIEEAEEEVDANVDIMSTQISGSGLDYIDIYVDTTRLNTTDSFRIQFTGAADARYNTKLNDLLDVTAGGTYTFESLNKEGFNIRATSDDDVNFEYTSENGTPVIKVISNKANNNKAKELSTTVITLSDGAPVSAITGAGYENVTIDFNTENLAKNAKFDFYVDTVADITVNGSSYNGKIAGLTNDAATLNIDNLYGEEFTAYAVSADKVILYSNVEIKDTTDGSITFVLSGEEERTKTVYTYSDSKVSVTATLTDPTAVPDDAEFVVTEVTPLTSEYNYDAYMDALNENAELIDDNNSEYNEENTLLYDVAFFVDDENGNRVEYQPEAGTVLINISFKMNQLEAKADDSGDAGDATATIIHLPLNDNVKNNVDSTAEATNISASDIKVEVVAEEISATAEAVRFELSDLSIVAATINGKNVDVKSTALVSYRDILGDAVNYGVTANTLTFKGHCDTNFATGLLQGNAQITQGKYTGNGNPGNDIIADYNGTGWWADSGNKAYKIITTSDVKKILEKNSNITSRTYITIDGTNSKEDLAAKVSSMVSGTMSSSFASSSDANNFADIARVVASNDYRVEISDDKFPAGTYIINFADGEYARTCGQASNLKIYMRSDQVVVFNIPDQNISLQKFEITVDGNHVYSDGHDGTVDKYLQHVVWNIFGEDATVECNNMFGIVLAPNGNASIGGTSTGWLVCDNMTGNSGEWHGVWQEMPPSESTSIQFKAKKYINGTQTPTSDQVFEFWLQDTDHKDDAKNSPWTLLQQKQSNGSEVVFDSITYNATGTYHYDIAEHHSSDDTSYIWDEHHYQVTVKVGKPGNDYVIESVEYKKCDKDKYDGPAVGESEIVFDNNEPNPAPAKFKFGVRKVLEQYVQGDNPTNTFTLIQTSDKNFWSVKLNKDNYVEKIIGTPIKEPITFNSYADGVAAGEFEEIEYDTPGKYYYVVLENNGNKKDNWVATDGHYYGYAIVTVEANPNGRDVYVSKVEASKNINADRSLANVETVENPSQYTFEFKNIKANYNPGYYRFEATKKFGDGETWPDGYETTLRLVSMDSFDEETYSDGNWISNETGSAPMPTGSVTGKILYPFRGANGSIEYREQTATYKDVVVTKDHPTAVFGEMYFPYDIPDGARTGDAWAANPRRPYVFEGSRCRCYLYKVYEVLPNGATADTGYTVTINGNDITYDTKVQRIKLWVNQITDSVGNYKAVVDANGSEAGFTCDGSLAKVEFTNHVTTNTKIDIPGKKVVNPDTYGIPAGKFTFEITALTEGAPMPKDANGNVVTSVKNTGTQGEFKFENIEFKSNNAGKTYEYSIKEHTPTVGDADYIAGMAYSNEEYKVTVTVTKTGNAVTATKSVEKVKGTGTSDSVIFTNNYSAQGSTTFAAKKELKGRDLKENEFEFKLESGDADGNNRAELKTAKNKDAAGNVDFAPYKATYSVSDIGKTFYYYVTEVEPTDAVNHVKNGVTYSQEEYRYVVTVGTPADNAEVSDGKAKLPLTIVKEKKIDGAWSTYTETPKFTNVYNTKGGTTLSAQKVTQQPDGISTLSNLNYEIKVTEANSEWGVKADGFSASKTIKGADLATFTGIEYSAAGTYYYIIEEVLPAGVTEAKPTKDGVTYDTTKHKVVVVVEDDATKGELSVKSQTNDGKPVDIGTAINITNSYSVQETEAVIEGEKSLVNKDLEKGKYSFVISGNDDASKATLTGVTTEVTNGVVTDNSKIKFGPIKYAAPGTYSYTVSEKQGDEENVKYDATNYTVTVKVEDNGDGTFKTPVVKYFVGSDEQAMVFTNEYKPNGTATIYAKKNLVSKVKSIKDQTFTFELLASDKTTVLDTKTTSTTDGSVAFAPISYTYDQIDTIKGYTDFTYYVHETNIPNPKPTGWEYDSGYHAVKVRLQKVRKAGSVKDELETIITYDHDGTYTSEPSEIKNTYDAVGSAEIKGEKLIVGRKWKNGETFTVRLKPTGAVDNDGNAITDSNLEQTLPVTKTSGNNGQFKFIGLTYTQPGVYEYEVTEDRPATATEANNYTADGIRYDTTVFKVKVTVSDATTGSTTEWGKLTTAVEYVDKGGIVFKNNCDSKNEFTPVASKVLFANNSTVARSLKKDQFTFHIEELGGNNYKDDAKNDGLGSVTFAKQTYTKPGTHTYIITETSQSNDAYICNFEGVSYKVVVELAESESSELAKTVKYYKSIDGGATYSLIEDGTDSDVVFKNYYKASGSETISGKKELKDSLGNTVAMTIGEFEFELVESGKVIKTVPNNADGSFSFALTYNQSDLTGPQDSDGRYVKTYTLREKKDDDKKYYGYAQEEYTVLVTLEDDGSGDIKTSKKIVDADAQPVEQSALSAWFAKLFKQDSKEAVFTNTYDAYGKFQLTAKKDLVGKTLTPNMFSFTLTGEGVNQTKGNAADGSITFDAINYSLKDIGTHTYTVSEVREGVDENGKKNGILYAANTYTINVVVKDDTRDGVLEVSSSVSGITMADTKSTMTVDGKTYGVSSIGPVGFLNTYIPGDAKITLGGEKILNGVDAADMSKYAGWFSFTMANKDGNPKTYTSTKSNEANGKFTFDEITFTQADLAIKDSDGKVTGYKSSEEFAYTITEDASNKKAGIDYDAVLTKDVVIVVTDDGNGNISASVKGGAPAAKAVSFTNTKVEEGKFFISVKKEVVGTDATDKSFKFISECSDGTKAEVSAKNGEGSKNFPEYAFTLEDVKAAGGKLEKTYTIYEVDEKLPGYTYSTDSHTVKVEVTQNGSKLNIKKTVDGEEVDNATVSFVFENTYEAYGTTEIKGKKNLTGGRPLAAGEFTFGLFTDASCTAESRIATTTNDADGKFSFNLEEVLGKKFDQGDKGTKTYYVKELTSADDASVSDVAHVDYDDTIYEVVVSITDLGNGELKVEPVYKKGEATYKLAEFNNTFADSKTVTFAAEKKLNNMTLKAGMFDFTLHELAGGKMEKDETISNTAGGAVNFATVLTFNQTDVNKEFKYEITEVKKSGTPFSYSDDKFYAKVDVKIEDGELKATRKYYSDINCTNEIAEADVKFVNTYTSKDSIQIGGSKQLKGFEKRSDKGEYTFILKNSDNSERERVTVHGAEPFKFEKINYTEADFGKEYKYTVEELHKGETIDNVEYSSKVATITVTFSYNEDMTLKANAVSDTTEAINDLVFINTYVANGSKPLEGTKKVVGKNLESQKYTFELRDADGNMLTEVKNEGSTFKITAGSSLSGTKYLQYTQDDIGEKFVYTVVETKAEDGSDIDETIYTVIDTIGKNEKGEITIDRKYTKPDGKGGNTAVDGIVFENTYWAKGSIPIEGIKTMKNRSLNEGEFTFILKDENGEVVQKVGNPAAEPDENGNAKVTFAFDDLEFDQDILKISDSEGNVSYLPEKTLYYTITEEGTVPGVTNDTREYTVAITVKHSGNNDHKLDVTKVVTADKLVEEDTTNKSIWQKLKDRIDTAVSKITGEPIELKIEFVNEYDAKGFWDPQGNKTLTGREFANGEFEFKISEISALSTANGGKVNLAGVVDGKTSSVPNQGTRVIFNHDNVSFLTYGLKDCGTHYYRVEELEPDNKKAGDIYDKTIFEYVVEVKNAGDGTITATTKQMYAVDVVNGSIAPATDTSNFEFTFNNRYEAAGYIDLPATKVMIGRDLGNDKYNFTIVDDATGIKKTVQNDGNSILFSHDGAFTVPFLNYTSTGTHTYTIYEEDTTDVVKDSSIYRVTVNVSDNKDASGKVLYDGKLNAKVTKVEKKLPGSNNFALVTGYDSESLFTFENRYEASAQLDFTGLKNLIKYKGGARVLDPAEYNQKFSFSLYQYSNEERTVGKRTLATTNCNGNGEYKLTGPKYTQNDLLNADGKTYGTEKTYYYQIVEVTPSRGAYNLEGKFVGNDGVTYDNTVYNIDVKVTPSANNKLNLEVKKINPDGTANIMNPDMSGTSYTLGGFDYTNIKPEFTEIYGKKYWNDGITNPSDHPDVTIRLHQIVKGVDTEIDKFTIVAPATEYKFTGLKIVTEAGDPITYKVTEDPIPGYTSEQVGYNFYNTKGDIIIRKIDARTGAPLEGAVLAILNSAGTEVERWTSGTSAHVVAATLDLGATYTLHEVSAPRGYMVAADQKFTVPSNGGDIVVTMEDPQVRGNVRLLKLDAATRERLSGAEFALYTEAGTRVFASTSGGAGSYRYSETASNGRFIVSPTGELAISDLPYGTYYFVETVAPVGYEINPARIAFTVLDNDATYEVTCLDTKAAGSVRLVKTNLPGSRTLAGATFELYAKTPTSASAAIASTIYRGAYYRVGTYTTDASGSIYVGDLPWDDYYFIETVAPAGYTINTDTNGDPIVYTFTISDTSTESISVDLGRITNTTVTPPPTPPTTPPTTPPRGVRGERKPDNGRRTGGVLSGVLGVRAAPTAGVLGERVGPVTGDAANVALWLLLLIACVSTIIGILVSSRRRTRRAR